MPLPCRRPDISDLFHQSGSPRRYQTVSLYHRQQSTVYFIEERKENSKINTVHITVTLKPFLSRTAQKRSYQEEQTLLCKKKKNVYTLDIITLIL